MNRSDKCCVITKKKTGIIPGILYGLFPHFFCVAFIIFSVVGATAGAIIVKRFLLIPYFFHLLILISVIFATISAILYLKKCDCLSCSGAKSKWQYLMILYGTTFLINVLMFSVVFPVVANLNNDKEGQYTNSSISIKVDIPCSGHAPFIIDELKKINGVSSAKFKVPNIFDINYNKDETSAEKILSLDIFKTYNAILK